MKTFFIILTVLIVLAGIGAFIYGWVTLFVPPDTYCVAFTKTGGFDSRVIEPGKFVWRWERLIPTNMTLYKFKLEPIYKETEINGELPSGSLYSSVMPGNPDFSYSIKISFSMALKPSYLPELVKEKGLRPNNFNQWMKSKIDSALVVIANYLQTLKNPNEYVKVKQLNSELLARIEEKYPFLKLIDITVVKYEMPDITLYDRAKKIYLELAETEKNSQESVIQKAETQRVKNLLKNEEEKQKLERYREYGKLLTQYPILLKYFALKSGEGDKLNLNLPDIESKNGSQ